MADDNNNNDNTSTIYQYTKHLLQHLPVYVNANKIPICKNTFTVLANVFTNHSVFNSKLDRTVTVWIGRKLITVKHVSFSSRKLYSGDDLIC
jgi:hypothetical protein